MKSMQFHQLSKIALPIVKDCLILLLILVTRSLHVLPLPAPGGVCSWGVPGPRGCLLPGGVCLVLGGSLLRGGGFGIPACTEADLPMNRMTDRQPLKHNLRNFIADGNYYLELKNLRD